MYSDNLNGGAPSPTQALQLMADTHEVFARGGFPLARWFSNSLEVMQAIPEELQEPGALQCLLKGGSFTVLGLEYFPGEDAFGFRFADYEPPPQMSRHHVLTEISSIFDQLGFLADCTFCAKFIFQTLWDYPTLPWDAGLRQVDQAAVSSFIQWRHELTALNQLRFPRLLFPGNAQRFEVHVFADASAKGCGAIIYLKWHTSSQSGVTFVA